MSPMAQPSKHQLVLQLAVFHVCFHRQWMSNLLCTLAIIISLPQGIKLTPRKKPNYHLMTTGATCKSVRRRAEPVPALYFSPRYSNISLKNADAFIGFSKQFFMLETRLSIVVAANPTVAISAVSASTAASINVLPSLSPSLMRNMAMQSAMLSFIICAGLLRGGCGRSMSPVWGGAHS